MRLLSVILAILIVVIAAGFYFQWFSFTTNHDEDNKEINLTFKVNTEKIKGSVDKVQNAVKPSDKKSGESTASEKANGKLVDVEENSFTMAKADGKAALRFELAPSAKIERKGEKVQLRDLHKGEEVSVTYVLENGKNIAEFVTATQNSKQEQ